MAASTYACCRRAVLLCRQHYVPLHTTRSYARGIKRTPIAVRTSEDDLKMSMGKGIPVKDPRKDPFLPFIPGDPVQSQLTKKANEIRQPVVKNMKKASSVRTEPRIQSKTSGRKAKLETLKTGLQYDKLEDGDKRFGRILMAAKSRKEREKVGLIVLEGRRLILDSLQAGAQLKYLYFTDTALVSSLPTELVQDAELYKVQYRHLKLWADTHSPSGILGVFAQPAVGEVMCPHPDTLPLTLICDNVRDPGNMGTVIRTAAAAGCRKILTTKGCVDVWDPKVLRAAMGGHFFTCLLNNQTWEQIANHITQTSHVFIADSRKDSVLERSFDLAHPKVMDLVSTGDDSSDDTMDSTDSGTDDGSSSDSGNASDDEGDEEGDESWSKRSAEAYRRVPLSVVQYSDMDCAGAEEVTLIVGGETAGISAQAKKLAFDLFGQYVTLPMAMGMDSLNTSTAAAIVLYEVRKQLLSQRKPSTAGPREKPLRQ